MFKSFSIQVTIQLPRKHAFNKAALQISAVELTSEKKLKVQLLTVRF